MSDAEANGMPDAIERLNKNRLLRILAPLIHKGACLIPLGDEGADGYGYGRNGDSVGDGSGCVSAADGRLLLAQNLIERHAKVYRISTAGRAWLKRQLAMGDRFQAQHNPRSVRTGEGPDSGRLIVVNDAESPLAWLARRNDKAGNPMIAPYQFAAGERLRADYTYGALTARVTSGYDAAFSADKGKGRGSGGSLLSDTALAARQRVAKALTAVGPELSGVLVDVCCHLKGLEDAEKEEGWPKRSGKIVLQIALTRLARHYGLVSDGQAGSGLRRRLQHWGASDYRPRIDGAGPPRGAAEAG